MKQNIFLLLKPYRGFVVVLALFTIAGGAFNLAVPRLVASGIDSYAGGAFDMRALAFKFMAVAVGMLVFTYAQGVAQTYLSEKVARDSRRRLAEKISGMSYARLEQETPAKLLTNLTSDIEAIKMFASFGIVTIISSVILIIGAAVLLIHTNWKLGLSVLALLPLIGVAFAFAFGKMGKLFEKAQGIVDRLNATISESVVGAALVRVFDTGEAEIEKFRKHNSEARDTGLVILKYFALLIPFVGLVAGLTMIVILALGGKFVVAGSMTIGDFTAFTSYVAILIFPIIMLGFVSNILSRAQASYGRIGAVLELPDEVERGTDHGPLKGGIEAKDITLAFGEKTTLDKVSFAIRPGSKNAIIGPTAAGKTQLLYILIGLVKPTSGQVLYDGKPLESFTKAAIHAQAALVFQDSVMFNLTLRENIAFSATAKDEDVKKAIETAELSDFVGSLPQGLDTVVSERGTSLSGGQKQRVMLARALALNPKVLFLDDFTARVDAATEKKILANVEKNYPGITIVSVTQKVRSVEHYDQIVVLMEGEALAQGTHAELSQTSSEYAQILESQKSTESYE